MRTVWLAILFVTVTVAEVTVAPLFPIRGASPDFALVTLMALAVFSSPRTVMVALPVLSVMLGFSTDRAPGLLLLGYLPLLPLAAYLNGGPLPLNRYAQVLAAGAATGLWSRGLLAFGSIAQGADLQMSALLGDVLIPGFLLDVGLITIVYFPFRLVGWSPRQMTLQRGGF
jgi:hypothetical protein